MENLILNLFATPYHVLAFILVAAVFISVLINKNK
jgi:hypothetical protein